MKKCLLFIIFLFATFIKPSPVFAESESSVYWGAFDPDIPAFESNAGKRVSLILFFDNWATGNFPTAKVSDIRGRGSIPIISWDSYVPDNSIETSWKRISEGSMDSYIRKWAQESKNWGYPYFLRFNWEMNGYWQPYSSQAEYYIPMWIRIYDIFTQEGVNNATWVWCPNVDSYATQPLELFYPGNDYVDWVCMDGYNFGTSESWSSWQSFSSFFSPTYNHLLQLAPGKPIMIAEIGSSEMGGSKANWITDMLEVRLPSNFPNIKALVWFNINKEDDWRIESSNSSRAAFAKGVSSSYYLSNQFGNISSSPIPYFGSLSSKTVVETVSTPTSVPATPTIKPANVPTATVTPTKPPVYLASDENEDSREGVNLSGDRVKPHINIFMSLFLFGALVLLLFVYFNKMRLITAFKKTTG